MNKYLLLKHNNGFHSHSHNQRQTALWKRSTRASTIAKFVIVRTEKGKREKKQPNYYGVARRQENRKQGKVLLKFRLQSCPLPFGTMMLPIIIRYTYLGIRSRLPDILFHHLWWVARHFPHHEPSEDELLQFSHSCSDWFAPSALLAGEDQVQSWSSRQIRKRTAPKPEES